MEEHETPLPADWAIQAAEARLAKSDPRGGAFKTLARWIVVEFACMIEKHEEAPDPLAADREFMAGLEDVMGWDGSASYFRAGQRDYQVRAAMSYLRANVDKITGSA